jgi:hypothetical protein
VSVETERREEPHMVARVTHVAVAKGVRGGPDLLLHGAQ